jgi:hypothetical protein
MRPVRVTLNAAGYSQWVPIDYLESWFGTTLGIIPSEDGNLTYSVQFTMDFAILEAPSSSAPVSIARAGTVATVTDAGPLGIGHGLTTGDSVIIKASGSSMLDSPQAVFGQGDLGWQVASTPSPTTYTYTVANSGPAADVGITKTSRLRIFTHATLAAQTTRQNGSLNYPVRAVRLYVSAYTAGFVDMIVLQGSAK